MIRLIFVILFSTFCSLITIAQSRDLKSAHEDFVNRKTDASLTKLKKYFAEAKKVEIEDAILYYWLFSNNLAVPGTNQDLEFAYELIQDCMQYSVKLKSLIYHWKNRGCSWLPWMMS